MPAVVAIIGRPNVGKSTLFNRILGRRIAIESPISGTTRDPVSGLYEGEKIDMLFVDTGGLEFGKREGEIEENVQKQAEIALQESDMVVFCISTKNELTSADHQVARLLRKRSGTKPILVVGTMKEGKSTILDEGDLYSLGLGENAPIFISALQGIGTSKLVHKVENILWKRGFQKDAQSEQDRLSIAVLGRPNVGKSSLINALSDSEKLIVSEIAGTTRDSVDMDVAWEKRKFRFIDTAGIRRKSKIVEELEEYSVLRSLVALHRADITLFLISAEEGVTHQDKRILEHVIEAKTGVILGINKWDLQGKGEEEQKMFHAHLQKELPFLPWAPVLFLSALERKNIYKIFDLSEQIVIERKKRVSTAELNAFLSEVQQLHPLAGIKNTFPKIKYGSQVGILPPHFIFHGRHLQKLHFSSQRYLENRLRDAFGFAGTPIIMEMKGSKKRNFIRRIKHKSVRKSN